MLGWLKGEQDGAGNQRETARKPELPMRLQIGARQAGNVMVLDLNGQLVMGNESCALGEHVNQLVSQKKTSVLLNMQNVVYIDSFGVSELVASLSSLKKSGGILKLCNPSQLVGEVLQATRLLNVLELYSTEEEALASFE